MRQLLYATEHEFVSIKTLVLKQLLKNSRTWVFYAFGRNKYTYTSNVPAYNIIN